jgi:hypothetical protein
MTSFWPDDIARPTAKAPVAILKEQASFLGKKTRNLVEVKIAPNETYSGGSTFSYDFNIVAPTLNFSYGLFSIVHGIGLYPVFFKLDDSLFEEVRLALGEGQPDKSTDKVISRYGKGVLAKSEEEFEGILKAILNSEKTKRVIRGIIAQVS